VTVQRSTEAFPAKQAPVGHRFWQVKVYMTLMTVNIVEYKLSNQIYSKKK